MRMRDWSSYLYSSDLAEFDQQPIAIIGLEQLIVRENVREGSHAMQIVSLFRFVTFGKSIRVLVVPQQLDLAFETVFPVARDPLEHGDTVAQCLDLVAHLLVAVVFGEAERGSSRLIATPHTQSPARDQVQPHPPPPRPTH